MSVMLNSTDKNFRVALCCCVIKDGDVPVVRKIIADVMRHL